MGLINFDPPRFEHNLQRKIIIIIRTAINVIPAHIIQIKTKIVNNSAENGSIIFVCLFSI